MYASGSAQVRGRRVAAKFTSASSSVPKPRACWGRACVEGGMRTRDVDFDSIAILAAIAAVLQG
jgi:hypothetical protein